MTFTRRTNMTDANTQQATAEAADSLETLAAGNVLHEKLADAMTPGLHVEFDPEEAEQAGAFVEDALSEQDAAESGIDLAAANVEGYRG
jgi:hypothetical protein